MIYFAQDLDGGPVKIGCTDNLPVRLKQLEAHYGRPLALLGTMEGGPHEERAIHGRFAHLRFGRTERFRPAGDLMDFIGRPLLVGPNPEAVEAMPAQSLAMQVRNGRVGRLLVAGNRESSSPGIGEWVEWYMGQVFALLREPPP